VQSSTISRSGRDIDILDSSSVNLITLSSAAPEGSVCLEMASSMLFSSSLLKYKKEFFPDYHLRLPPLFP
jgi:hypothetical protein